MTEIPAAEKKNLTQGDPLVRFNRVLRKLAADAQHGQIPLTITIEAHNGVIKQIDWQPGRPTYRIR
jgi:hypothetical protein